MDQLKTILDSPDGSLFFNSHFNVIEEINISSLLEPRDDIDCLFVRFLDLLSRFPNLRYMSLYGSVFHASN